MRGGRREEKRREEKRREEKSDRWLSLFEHGVNYMFKISWVGIYKIKMIRIYHNNRCSKSRCALEVLEESGKEFEIVSYLQDTPDSNELTAIIKKLGITAHELIRKTEPIYIAEYKGKDLSEAEWIEAMVAHPILIERPIIVSGDRAVIARPTEKINEILG